MALYCLRRADSGLDVDEVMAAFHCMGSVAGDNHSLVACGERSRSPSLSVVGFVCPEQRVARSKTSAFSRLHACICVRQISVRLPGASTQAWIFVPNPARLCSIACACTSTVGLMSTHNCCIDHSVFFVRLLLAPVIRSHAPFSL